MPHQNAPCRPAVREDRPAPSPGLAAACPLKEVMPRAGSSVPPWEPRAPEGAARSSLLRGSLCQQLTTWWGFPGGSKLRVKGGERKAPETQPLLPSLRRRARRRRTQVPGSWPRKGEGAAQAAGVREEFIKHRRENKGEGTRLTPGPVLGPALGPVQTDPALQICTTFSKSCSPSLTPQRHHCTGETSKQTHNNKKANFRS